MGVAPVLPQRHTWIDALRLFAGLSMVGLHATADPMGQPFADASPQERLGPMVLRAVLYTARTELFLMISVLLLLMALDHRPRGYGTVLQQQARRLLVPFIFWTAFYAAYGILKAQQYGYSDAEIARVLSPAEWLGFLLLGDVKYHMHFIPTLFALILFFPLFRLSERQPIWGLLILILLLVKRNLDGVVYQYFWDTDVLPYLARLIKVTTYVGYGMAAGAILGLWRKFPAKDRISWVPVLLLIAVFLFYFKAISTARVVETGAWDFAYEPGYWADFLMPALVLALCMCLAERQWPAWISKVSMYSFGIYLCHPIFLDLAEITIRDLPLPPMQQVLSKLAWTLPATCGFVFALSKMPSLAWTIGLGSLPRLLTRGQTHAHLE
ncbi:acyltransferase [Shimia haliotis]|uniref:Surface polysaccharide O-acyltransferase, integral membrane enzyme n=1 Tax=Shimia haliotis TaxID=1280847 RepID=A0A1I4FRY2_9RHOB|nr:acyltransferase [Shimia haliotis]SFL19431.1 Surface polysaccharide O-acyltransferase, integral membrane enzyme [Shimia haliotis]